MKQALKIAILCAVLLPSTAFAEQIAVSTFKYLNSNDASVAIDPSEAQDLMNVDITPGGKSVKKRAGYGTYKAMGTGLGMHGGYHFFDSNGADVQLWGSSTTLKGIVSDATPVVLVTSATSGSTWDCVDSQGSAYCANSNRDGLFKTNGSTLQLWTNSVLGNMVEITPDRLAVAGVSAAPSTIFHSEANTFTNFTVGPKNSDAFTEVIAAPGAKLTHIRWGCGKLLWWKDQSFGYEDFDDQYSLSVKIVSDTIGTLDNTSAVDPGGNVWFRGQDGHIWRYDCSGLTKETIEISPQVQASGRRTSNLLTYTSQADFQLGTSSGTNSLSTTITAGSVLPSSFTKTENAASGWASGTVSNLAVGTSSMSIVINNSGNVSNNGFENCGSPTTPDNWTQVAGGFVSGCGPSSEGCNLGSCTVNPRSGSGELAFAGSTSGFAVTIEALDAVTGAVLASKVVNQGNYCAWSSATLLVGSNFGKRFKLRLSAQGASYTTTDSYVFGGDITLYYNGRQKGLGYCVYFDDITSGSSTVNSGSFASQVFNTGAPWSNVYTSATWAVNTATPSFVLQKSANGTSGWTDITTSTGINVQSNMQYLRYLSTFTVGPTDNALSSLTGVNIIARSSGTYYSAVRNAPNLSAWSTFLPTWTDNGDDINLFVRSSTSPFYVMNSSPPWVAQSAGTLVSASTGTYFQTIASFTVTAATNTPSSLDAFTINWFEGTAADQAYLTYFDNAIWASVSYGVGVSSNTNIFRRDLINDGWGLYNFGAGGMLVQNNHLFFGDVSTNSLTYQFGSGTADNGAAIPAFWKSKDFTGSDPFLENQLTNIDSYFHQDAGQSLTVTYTVNTASSTSYTVNMSSTTQSVIQHRKLLPSGRNGYVCNVKFGDTSATSAWELFGFRLNYVVQPYRPSQ